MTEEKKNMISRSLFKCFKEKNETFRTNKMTSRLNLWNASS